MKNELNKGENPKSTRKQFSYFLIFFVKLRGKFSILHRLFSLLISFAQHLINVETNCMIMIYVENITQFTFIIIL